MFRRPNWVLVTARAGGVMTTGFQPGVSIVFTRIDTARNGLWHGRISVPRQKYTGKVYALRGTFAAGWCGTKRS